MARLRDGSAAYDALGVLPWLVTGRVVKAKLFDERAAKLYDTVGVPLGSFAERFAAPWRLGRRGSADPDFPQSSYSVVGAIPPSILTHAVS